MYQSLYRKYRPRNFEEVVGQEIVVKTLIHTIEKKQLTHAYLFTGPRGTGKTSIAKILAKTVNCENSLNAIPCEQCVNCTQYNNKQNSDIIEKINRINNYPRKSLNWSTPYKKMEKKLGTKIMNKLGFYEIPIEELKRSVYSFSFQQS